MNKVIAALDGLKLSQSTVDYSTYLAKDFDAHIVAAFLEDIAYRARPNSNEEDYIHTDWSEMDTVIEKEQQFQTESKRKLKERFDAEGVHYNIHQDKVFALQSLVQESSYADMIVIDGEETFSNLDYSKPSHFLRNLLSESQCPVMVVPKVFKPIEKVVFAYDGSPASIYAIKQFNYLFRLSGKQNVEILSITDDNHTNHLPNHHLLKELLKQKYSKVLQSILKRSDTDEAFLEHMKTENKNCLLVLGAYQRSSFSRWLYQSIADTLIYELDIPLFIAHK
jgi:hypothetical protein